MELSNASSVATQIDAEIRSLPAPNTAAVRAVRRQYSTKLKQADAAFVLDLARTLIKQHDQRWVAYELVRYHRDAYQQLGPAELEELGQGINSWDTVDAFARTLSGALWLKGQIDDALITRWAHSDDVWWRRAALVSTVALNMRSQGSQGDVDRTLAICRLLVSDQEDMIVKAMSWALRQLVIHQPEVVIDFMAEHEAELAARVKREVMNKHNTGLKNPKTKAD